MYQQDALMQITQLPAIEENLRARKNEINKRVAEALSLVCTEDTLQAVKATRAELNKEFKDLESQRIVLTKLVMQPIKDFEATYKECVADAYRNADADLKSKINDTESEIKQHCEDGLREYLAELCAVNHVEWLRYEQARVKVDMASARAKTPKKLREQLTSFVVNTVKDIDAIANMEDADEILAEYKQRLNFADAVYTVRERHKRIEQEREAKAAYEAAKAQEAEAVKRVEALASPVRSEPQEPIVRCTFTVHATRTQLRKLKEFLNMEGIKYERNKHRCDCGI